MTHTALRRLVPTALLLASLSLAASQTTDQGIQTHPAQSQKSVRAKARLDDLARRYYLAFAQYNPILASENGDNRFSDRLGADIFPEQRARQFARYRAFLHELKRIPRQQLDTSAQTNYDALGYELHAALRLEPFPEHWLPLNQMDALPVTLANYASGQAGQPLTNTPQFEAYLRRLQALPAWIDQAIANMRQGIKHGVTQPRAIVQAMLGAHKNLVSAKVEDSVYYTPARDLVGQLPVADQERLRTAYRRSIERDINPAVARLAQFLEQEYLPAARTSDGWNALPDGAAWYAANVANQTTTQMTPEQIHQLGVQEVKRIQAEFTALGPRLGYDGPPEGLPKWVETQRRFKPFTEPEQILDVYRQLNTRLQEKLPTLFSLVPKAPLDIRREPELTRATASDHYTAPAPDGSRPGIFWTVINKPEDYGNTFMTTLFLHEGQPGHHFHLALQQELALPDFRRFGGNTAFVEGWALYAETLGRDMGLFDKPVDYYGHLSSELLRAIRLVVDTGVHAKGWSREKAMAYYAEVMGATEQESKQAIERYMAWPGQALSYKVGAIRIANLRARASAALGSRMSLPAFHAVVLGDGTLPLDLLERKVDRWIASQCRD
ncbi:DUF885 family protein [Chitinimonas sp.]|uniref:DUF885 domain-containing protein n=1 Tax=Chitinimonas sp. TaxID=1934313 RepID=UPI0035B22043